MPKWAARLYLNDRESAVYRQSPKSAWLLRRIAAKHALRDWMLQNRGVKLHALEVEIGNRADGSPEVVGLDGADLALSISHLEDEGIALVTAGERAGVDMVASMEDNRVFPVHTSQEAGRATAVSAT